MKAPLSLDALSEPYTWAYTFDPRWGWLLVPIEEPWERGEPSALRRLRALTRPDSWRRRDTRGRWRRKTHAAPVARTLARVPPPSARAPLPEATIQALAEVWRDILLEDLARRPFPGAPCDV